MAVRIYPLTRGSVKTLHPIVVFNSQVKTLKLNAAAESLLASCGNSDFVSYTFDENEPYSFWIKPSDSIESKRLKRAINTPTYSAALLFKRFKNLDIDLSTPKAYIFSCFLDKKRSALKVKIGNERI